jgi:hypothetical protein
MSALFQPKDGKARWRAAYEQMLQMGIDYGAQFSHEVLAALLGLALEGFRRNRAPLYRVIGELEKEHGRTLVPILGKGYRVSAPGEHAALARERRRRSRRHIRRGVELIEATDRTLLAPDQLTEMDKVHASLGLVYEVLSIHESRLTVYERRTRRIEEILRKNGML